VPAVFLGVLTIAEAVGGMSVSLTTAIGGLAGPIGDLDLQASAAVQLGAQFSVVNPVQAVDAILGAAAQVVDTIAAQIPTTFVQGNIDATGSLNTTLTAKADALKACIDTHMMTALGTGGIYAFSYAGAVNQVGSSLDGVIPDSGLTGSCIGILLLASTPEAQASLKLVFGLP
jgi:hypothetical protein